MRELKIAYGGSRAAKIWSNKLITFDALCERLQHTVRTPETAEEYPRLPREERDRIKDKGGFVGGWLKNGRRKAASVECRSMLTHDVDKPDAGFLDRYRMLNGYASVVYSTHSHTPESPRYRIITPLQRDVSPEEYFAITRYLAADYGIDCIDRCSYSAHQLMYWPTTPSNGEYVFERFDGGWLDPDAFLAQHPNWRDVSQLPTSSRESTLIDRERKRQKDPLEKGGVIGAFNNAHFPLQDFLDEHLSDVYEPSSAPNRYKYRPADSMAGAILYDDRYLYSNHASDPAYGQLLSAFDLLRVHRFGDMGEKESLNAALDCAREDEPTRAWLAKERIERAQEEFGEGDGWLERLEVDRAGKVRNTLRNITLIVENDPALKGVVFNQLADGMEIRGEVPWKHPARFWRDADDAQLINYVDARYGSFSARNYELAVTKVADDRSYHPIREYFASLPEWDGEVRVERLLIDYLGAADTPYVRAVTRKTLCAAVARVLRPGVKFDNILVLNGAQGIGKSTLIAKLGGDWYSDSLSISDMNDKTAAEKLQGYWILEIGELAGMRKADLDKVKAFISRQDDKYRASFGRRVTPHPRQCVFFGTTNSERGYLRDITGNRRFWTVKTPGGSRLHPWDLTDMAVRQIWAEALFYVKAGERLYLDADLEQEARGEQREAMEQDDREGLVRAYLDRLLPDNWEKMDVYRRQDYIRDPGDPTHPEGRHLRTAVSNMEIWCECFGKRKEELHPADSYAIAAIMERIEGWERSGKFSSTCTPYGKQRLYVRRGTH